MRFHRIVRLSLLALVPACGGNPPPATDDGGVPDFAVLPDLSAPVDMVPAPPVLPQVNAHSGIVLSSLKLVTITFGGTPGDGGTGNPYPSTQWVQQWGDFVVTSNWIKATGSEYGVGTGTHAAKVVLPIDPGKGITDQQVRTLIMDKIMDNTLPTPTKQDNQYLYMIYFPSTTTVNEPDGSALCSVFSGYHSSMSFMPGARIIYAIVGDCSGNPDDITSTAAHELMEAATDPYPNLSGSYFVDPADTNDPWTIEFGQEVGDLCETEGNVYEGGFAFQPIWSNAAAAKLSNPCVPAADPSYTTVTAVPTGLPSVAAGQAMSFTLTGWATMLEPPWHISIGDGDNSDFSATELQAQLSAGTISRGTHATLTLKAPANAASGSLCGVQILSGPTGHRMPVGFYVQ